MHRKLKFRVRCSLVKRLKIQSLCLFMCSGVVQHLLFIMAAHETTRSVICSAPTEKENSGASITCYSFIYGSSTFLHPIWDKQQVGLCNCLHVVLVKGKLNILGLQKCSCEIFPDASPVRMHLAWLRFV